MSWSAQASASLPSLPRLTHQPHWRTTLTPGGTAPPGITPHQKALEATESQGARAGAPSSVPALAAAACPPGASFLTPLTRQPCTRPATRWSLSSTKRPPALAWAPRCPRPGHPRGRGPLMIPGACMVQAPEAGDQKIAGYFSALLGPPQPPQGLPLRAANGDIPAPEPHPQPLQLCPAEAAWERRGPSHLHRPHCLWPGILVPLALLTMWGPHQRKASPRKPGGLPASRR